MRFIETSDKINKLNKKNINAETDKRIKRRGGKKYAAHIKENNNLIYLSLRRYKRQRRKKKW